MSNRETETKEQEEKHREKFKNLHLLMFMSLFSLFHFSSFKMASFFFLCLFLVSVLFSRSFFCFLAWLSLIICLLSVKISQIFLRLYLLAHCFSPYFHSPVWHFQLSVFSTKLRLNYRALVVLTAERLPIAFFAWSIAKQILSQTRKKFEVKKKWKVSRKKLIGGRHVLVRGFWKRKQRRKKKKKRTRRNRRELNEIESKIHLNFFFFVWFLAEKKKKTTESSFLRNTNQKRFPPSSSSFFSFTYKSRSFCKCAMTFSSLSNTSRICSTATSASETLTVDKFEFGALFEAIFTPRSWLSGRRAELKKRIHIYIWKKKWWTWTISPVHWTKIPWNIHIIDQYWKQRMTVCIFFFQFTILSEIHSLQFKKQLSANFGFFSLVFLLVVFTFSFPSRTGSIALARWTANARAKVEVLLRASRYSYSRK